MTATRWWVRYFALWQARVDSATQEINMGLRAITASGITSGALKYYGLEEYALPFLAVVALIFAWYAKAVFDGGVKNQVSRDRMDMTDNFAAPGVYIGSQIQMRALGSALDAQQNGDDPEQAAQETVTKAWKEYRDGIDLDELENGHDETDLEEIEQ